MHDQENLSIDQLLQFIEDKYPPARIAASRARYENLWDVSVPFAGPPISIHRGVIMDGLRHPAYHTMSEMEATLREQLSHIAAMADIHDDYMPVLTLDTGAYIIGNAFGAEPIYKSNMYQIRHVIFSAEDAERLPDFNPDAENYLMRKVFAMLRFMRERTHERIRINMHTPQGPLETLGVMWDATDFMISLLEEPAVVRAAMEKVRVAYKYYLDTQKEIIGDGLLQCNYAMSYTHRPQGTGIGVGEDVMATISAEVFSGFLDVYARIAEDFGPLLVHSCGDPSHQLENLCGTGVVDAIHFSQVDPGRYFDRLPRHLVIHSPNDWADMAALEDFVRMARERELRFCIQIQSLGDCMQVGDDVSRYDVALVSGMYERIGEIVRKYYS